ncbi:probable beta-hexosaminidase fdl [Battus philenor]|uniref:probable beta-hexosaminidase fdl n=1 Tax=Battus philenor TaxID=42288 RepID=UPI0035CF72ED
MAEPILAGLILADQQMREANDRNQITQCQLPVGHLEEVRQETVLQGEYHRVERRRRGDLTEKAIPVFDIKKLYIAITLLLYHSCTNQKGNSAAADICKKLEKTEMEMILKLCQRLKSFEITVVNIEASIKAAYEATYGLVPVNWTFRKKKKEAKEVPDDEIAGINPPVECGDEAKSEVDASESELRTLLSPDDQQSEFSQKDELSLHKEDEVKPKNDNEEIVIKTTKPDQEMSSLDILELDVIEDNAQPCKANCNCTKCAKNRPTSSEPEETKEKRYPPLPPPRPNIAKASVYSISSPGDPKWNLYCALASMVLLAVIIVILCSMTLRDTDDQTTVELVEDEKPTSVKLKRIAREGIVDTEGQWQCKNHFCVKTQPEENATTYLSLSRCTLLCMGPQIWPHPIGYTHYSKTIVALSTTNLEYKFQSVPSEIVHNYLAGAFKLFLKSIFRLEQIDRNKQENLTEPIDLPIKRISIQIEVETDADPRIRLNTEEAYMININMVAHRVQIRIVSASFCGARHALETTSQLILLDQKTGYLITLSEVTIKDAPTYKYRGLMIDTGRNYIPVSDIMRTIDAMAACKLNTFHWRISSDTSFPLYLPKLPFLYEYGAYDRSMVYTKSDVHNVVKKAAVRGIRVLIEVTAPGPVGRPWSWFPQATCPRKSDNYSCENVLCMRLLMDTTVFDTLQIIYSEIIEMTGVTDVFHLSDGMFSMTNCYQLISDRDGFLKNALERLKLANDGYIPKLPIIWYSPHLMKDSEAKIWDRLGVQLADWDPNPGEQYLGKFRVIHSTKWDLSCAMVKQRCVKFRTWQEMYSWKTWRNIDVFTIEGGEAVLWTDLVNSGNLDSVLWPRAAAVAERLWSDAIANSTANKYVYLRLDMQRWRMILLGIKVQPIWPAWCSFNPSKCLAKIRK